MYFSCGDSNVFSIDSHVAPVNIIVNLLYLVRLHCFNGFTTFVRIVDLS